MRGETPPAGVLSPPAIHGVRCGRKKTGSRKKQMRRAGLSISLILAALGFVAAGAQALDVERIRERIREEGVRWTAGYTPQAALDFEARQRLAGTLPPVRDDAAPGWSMSSGKDELPDHFDWRDVDGDDWLTPVRDQGLCGGCAAFGAVGAFEVLVKYYELDDPGEETDLSEQHLFSCAGGSCSGGLIMGMALVYLRGEGVPDEACFPYLSGEEGLDYPCEDTCEDWRDRRRRITGWSWVDTVSRDNIRAAILDGPLYVYILTYEDFYAYTDGVYEHVEGGVVGGHGVTMIGYDAEEQYWICKNSWGESWGEEGYFRIRWGESEIESYMARLEYEVEPDDDDAGDDDTDDDDVGDDDEVEDDGDNGDSCGGCAS